MELKSSEQSGILSKGQNYFLTLSKNLLLLNKGREIISEFKDKHVDYLILKGLYLAFSVYPDAGLRPMADIDFLVKKEELCKIKEVLNKLGYIETSAKEQRIYGCDSTFYGKHGISIDIHWDLCQYERFKGVINITADFWRRAREVDFDETSIMTLSTEDHVLYVLLHYGLVHLFRLPHGAYDLLYLINGSTLDWEKIIDCASKYGIKTTLYYGLLKASEITRLKLPDNVLKRLTPCFLKKMLLNYLFKSNCEVSYYLCQALLLDSLLDTFCVLGKLLKAMPREYRRRSKVTFKDIPVAIRT
jgi:hypothetical protein